jgi:hypothetical protein
MHSLPLKKATFAALAATALCCAGQAVAAGKGWTAPDCRKITGAPNITTTVDEGARLARTRGEMAPYSYTFGLVPLEQPNTLLAAVGSQILRSTDVGCTWQPLADLTGQTGAALLLLESAGGSRAYGWAVNSNALATIDGDNASSAWVPGSGVTGFSVSRKDRSGCASAMSPAPSGRAPMAERPGRRSRAAGNFVYRTAFASRTPTTSWWAPCRKARSPASTAASPGSAQRASPHRRLPSTCSIS